ncbi:NADP-dependent malic enzyme [Pelistega ratti]|uniref:NADP-dependent malic enzyme n=1 Tax=Pelistega ratti TaxID=2652177 RepID=UPI00135B7125|nr:NADP-dependent malic enzyme [Pelistega ratti]
MSIDLKKLALDYHEFPKPGKISVTPTKTMVNQFDLSLAYSPGVAHACMEIYHDHQTAARYTSRSNLVGVITNGTAVLGLGNIGPLAAKPVMEGKGCLFKKFAGVDVFDIELAENDPDKIVDIICALEPTLGGINLEDIKAPECFYIEQKLRERMNIPVFHDDQHGTAIISTAAILNGLKLINKEPSKVKLVCSGAGAAAIACLDLLVRVGISRENIYVCDSKGVIYKGRDTNMEANKARYAQETDARTLADVINEADVFLGCSTKGVLTGDMVKTMAANPLILALANPDPEILPEEAKVARADVIIATGRSDYPNQVNNVLCFPFIFRGALDVGATTINEEMKLACVHAIAELAQAEQSDEVASAYKGQSLEFGPDYIIPKPFDPRLIVKIAPAIAQAAMDSGVATKPITDMDAYRAQLSNFVYHSGQFMRPLFTQAKGSQKRVAYADGEDERVLRAAQTVIDERIAIPYLIGRPAVIEATIKRLGLRLRDGQNITIINPEDNQYFEEAWQSYYKLRGRYGITPEVARTMVRKHNTLIGSFLLENGVVDALLCGTHSRWENQLQYISEVIGLKEGMKTFASMNIIIMQDNILFIADTHVNENPDAETVADITLMAADEMKRFGVEPKIALLSNSNFGSRPYSANAQKMAKARQIVAEKAPHLEVDGEMHADAALNERIRLEAYPDSTLTGSANLLIMPTLESGNISYNLLKMTSGNGITLGPILLGAAKPVHILTTSSTTRRIVNMTALAVIDALNAEKGE